jgi:hypothetical protein
MSMGDVNQPEGRRRFYLKQGVDIYTAMLILALVFVLIGCLFMFLELKAYDLQVKVAPDAKVTQIAPAMGNTMFAVAVTDQQHTRPMDWSIV